MWSHEFFKRKGPLWDEFDHLYETLFVSRAYYQMGYVFGRKIENNLEIEAYKRACDYQEAVHDTVWQSGILTSAQLTLMLAVLP